MKSKFCCVIVAVIVIINLTWNIEPVSAACSLCVWAQWNAWNACNATCGGGYRVRDRGICCNDLWTIPECVSNCGIQRSDARDYQTCNNICYNGGVYHTGSGCSCGISNYGSCCQNTITCGTPSSIANGRYTGTNFKAGGTITYSCDPKYQLVGGDTTHVCEKVNTLSIAGYWKGTVPKCVNVARCDSNPCKNGASCVNGLDKYTCTCKSGWSGTHCEFDIQPPVYTNCPSNMTQYTESPPLTVTWTEPTFSDPNDPTRNIIVTKNYLKNEAVMPWGEYVVQYVGDKQSNGLRAECKFTIKVLPKQCVPLTPPRNGAFACNGWSKEYTAVCTVFCENDKTVPPNVNIKEMYVCGASGNWMPSNTNVSCEENRIANTVPTEHYYSNTCTSNQATRQNIGNTYLDILKKSSWSELCTAREWDGKCVADQVQILC